MDNKLFIDEVLDHTHIGLYHELVISAQHAQMSKDFAGHTTEQVSQFAVEQAQATVKTLGYVRISNERLDNLILIRDVVLEIEEEFSFQAAEYLLSTIEELDLELGSSTILSTHQNLCKK